jgi:hypothetical protein
MLWKLKVSYHPVSLRSILILYFHLRLDLLSGLFSYGFPIKILYAFHFSPTRATFAAHLIVLDLMKEIYIYIIEYAFWWYSLKTWLFFTFRHCITSWLIRHILLATNQLWDIRGGPVRKHWFLFVHACIPPLTTTLTYPFDRVFL